MQMNSRQKEILQSQLDDEKAVLKKLQGIYKKALDDVDDTISQLMGRTDTENLQSIVYQLNYQNALKTQINGILDNLASEQYTTVSEYLAKCYEDGYIGTMYDLHGQGIPIVTPINQDLVVRAVQNEAPLVEPFYKYLGEDVNKLKKRVTNNISRGMAQGSSYADIARNIARGMVGDYSSLKGGALYDAYRIARTEGHRISNEAAYDAQEAAKAKGADIVKQWDATLDARTRPSHQRVDGEIRELDEKFSNGLMYPGDSSGGAAEVINCRCALLQRARWALDDERGNTKWDGIDRQLATIDEKDYNAFKNKYFDAVNEQGFYNIHTNDGFNITNKSFHSDDRKTERDVSIENIVSALKNPLNEVDTIVDGQGRPSRKYIGDKATAVINPDNGTLVTVWRTSSKTAAKLKKGKV